MGPHTAPQCHPGMECILSHTFRLGQSAETGVTGQRDAGNQAVGSGGNWVWTCVTGGRSGGSDGMSQQSRGNSTCVCIRESMHLVACVGLS